jgi:hypothetical protein
LIWLILLSRLVYRWPVVRDGVRAWLPRGITDAVRGGWDPFTETKSDAGQDRPYLTWPIVATIFCVVSLLPRDEVAQRARRWPTVLAGTGLQYLSMPLLAYGLGHEFGLPPDLMLGVVMVCSRRRRLRRSRRRRMRSAAC